MAQKYSIQLLTATTAAWEASQYVIPDGELIAELQSDNKIQLKVGDGLHKFSALPYVADKGQKGEAGVSPTVSTSKVGGAATVTITDVNGTHEFVVNDGASPTVETTKTGSTATITITDASGAHSFQIEDGTSPTISSTKFNGVTTVVVTDVNGAKEFIVNDGTSPTVETSKVDNTATVKITDANGEHTFTIKDGDKGDPLTYADLTEAQKLELKGDTGEGFIIKGVYSTLEELQSSVTSPTAGDAYAVGSEAPYEIYIYDGVGSSWVDHGQIQGAKGDSGAVFTPSVAANGDLSWTNNGGLTNPATINIKGEAGAGISGIERTSGDGTSGTTDVYTITYTDGSTSTFNVYNGKDAVVTVDGTVAEDGANPVSGKAVYDYVNNVMGDFNTVATQIDTLIGG